MDNVGQITQLIDHGASLQRAVRRLELELALLAACMMGLALIVLIQRLGLAELPGA